MDEGMSRISDAVVDDLTFDPDVGASGITVEDRDGEVVLAGVVRSGTERAAAEAPIAELTGVRTVTNDIQIRDCPTAACISCALPCSTISASCRSRSATRSRPCSG
jgi:hypothetical protein